MGARIGVLKRALRCGILKIHEVPVFLVLGLLSALCRKLSIKYFSDVYYRYLYKKIRKRYFDEKRQVYNFDGILLPDFEMDVIVNFFSYVFCDQIYLHCVYKNQWDKIDPDVHAKDCEGVYCYPFEGENTLVMPGDIVVDAGAWIGDFSIVAQYCGAKACYAFEPSRTGYDLLKRTAEINPCIIPVRKGLGRTKQKLYFQEDSMTMGAFTERGEEHETEDMISVADLDSYVKENGIERIDFIKADIEGAERDLLKGAAWVLKTFAPKLSLCTYHLPDDPKVMEQLILKSNPDYTIHHGPKKLYAWVKKG